MPALVHPIAITDTYHLYFHRWEFRTRPDIVGEPCKGFFEGGPTPKQCAGAMAQGYAAFRLKPDPKLRGRYGVKGIGRKRHAVRSTRKLVAPYLLYQTVTTQVRGTWATPSFRARCLRLGSVCVRLRTCGPYRPAAMRTCGAGSFWFFC